MKEALEKQGEVTWYLPFNGERYTGATTTKPAKGKYAEFKAKSKEAADAEEAEDEEIDETRYQKRPEPEPTVELKENDKVIDYGRGDPTERTHVARFIAHILSKLNELKPELPYCKVNQQMFDYLIKNRSGMLYPVNQLHGNAWIKAKITPNISVIIDNDLKYGAFTVGGFEIEKDREITVELTKDVN